MSIVRLLQDPPHYHLALEYVIRDISYTQYVNDEHEGILERVTKSQYEMIKELFNKEIDMTKRGEL